MLVRIVTMLTKLVERFDPDQYRVRENASGVAQSFDDEDNDEHEDERALLTVRTYFQPFFIEKLIYMNIAIFFRVRVINPRYK